MTYRHVFYLGNGRAVIACAETDNKQAVYARLNKKQRYWITVQGESHYTEPDNVKLDPKIKQIIQ